MCSDLVVVCSKGDPVLSSSAVSADASTNMLLLDQTAAVAHAIGYGSRGDVVVGSGLEVEISITL